MTPPFLLIHGAANGAWVWEPWLAALRQRGWDAHAPNLRGHGSRERIDLSRVTMEDYVRDVGEAVERAGRAPALLGWSMGGLVSMMYAAAHPETPALVLFAPSPPLEVQADARRGAGTPAEVDAIPDLFGPEYYGVMDDVERSRAALSDLTGEEAARVVRLERGATESGAARRQRKAGISVPAASVRCPVLVVYGEADAHFPPELCRKLVDYFGGEGLAVPDAGHWGLVASGRAVAEAAPAVDGWLRRHMGSPSP